MNIVTSKTCRPKPLKKEGGVYLVIAAIFLLVLVTVVFLALAVGFVTISETRLQNAVNFAAFGAIQEFETKNSDLNLTYQQKLDAALSRANTILNLNKIPGLGSSLGTLTHLNVDAAPSTIEFGMWWPTRATAGENDPCGGESHYPCFRPNPNYPAQGFSGTANAVRIKYNTDGDNSLIHPFLKLFGSGQRASLSASAIGTIVQRCTVLILDSSLSTSQETHHSSVSAGQVANPNPNVPSSWIFESPPNPAQVALPAYRLKVALQTQYPPAMVKSIATYPRAGGYPEGNMASNPPLLYRLCADGQPWRWDKVFFCNMIYNCPGTNGKCIIRPANQPVDPAVHYLSDYRSKASNVDYDNLPGGDALYVDSLEADGYIGPEPFSRYMLAFNAALRSMTAQSVAGDKAAALVIAGGIRDQVPATGMSEDLGYLTNLFNWANRGTVDKNGAVVNPEKHPNAVDRGWLPLLATDPNVGSTNLVLALTSAIDILSNSCPESAQKSIIMAGDGMGTCTYNGGTYGCDTSFASYLGSEDQLIQGNNSMLSRLIQSKIALTFILDGSYVQPNILNIWYDKNANGARDADEHFMTLEEARALGYGGLGAPAGKQFFNSTSSPSDELAFLHAGEPDYFFRRVNGVLGKMAFETGGIFCPVMDLCNMPECGGDCYYDDDGDDTTPKVLKSAVRQSGQMQTCATQLLSKAEQAAKCAVDTLGRNPYILTEEAAGN